MKTTAGMPFLALLVLAAGCTTHQAVDLARNPTICADLPFATRAPGDRWVFVAPLVDARNAERPSREGALPISYAPDEAWDRTPVEMLGELLERELAESGLFAGVTATASPEVVLLQPRLVAFQMGSIENIHGSRTFADVGIELQVFGPADAAGQRPLWFERVFAERQVTEPALKPINMFLLAGGTTARNLGKVMNALDGSNVGRSGVPIQTGAPAEASAPAK